MTTNLEDDGDDDFLTSLSESSLELDNKKIQTSFDFLLPQVECFVSFQVKKTPKKY